MVIRTVIVIFGFAIANAPLVLAAQTVDEDGSPWLTEAGYGYAATGPCADHYPSFELGRLALLGPAWSAGGTVFVGHNGTTVAGPRARLRYHATADMAVDVGTGILWGGGPVRPNVSVGLNHRDLFTVFAHLELDRSGSCGGSPEEQLFLGVKIGRKPGIVTPLIGRAVGAILIVVFISGVEN